MSMYIGEALVGVRSLGLSIVGTIMGSVLFRLLVAMALRWGLDPNDLKLITAVFVFCALVLPALLSSRTMLSTLTVPAKLLSFVTFCPVVNQK